MTTSMNLISLVLVKFTIYKTYGMTKEKVDEMMMTMLTVLLMTRMRWNKVQEPWLKRSAKKEEEREEGWKKSEDKL